VKRATDDGRWCPLKLREEALAILSGKNVERKVYGGANILELCGHQRLTRRGKGRQMEGGKRRKFLVVTRDVGEADKAQKPSPGCPSVWALF